MPLGVKNLPHEGYSERESSDAINQIIQFGSSGSDVFSGNSFSVPANHFRDVGPFRVNDPRVKATSDIILAPEDISSELASVFVSLISDGFFEVNDPPPELLFAVGSVAQDTGVLLGGLSGGVVLPFDTKDLEENITIAVDPANRITSKVTGILQISITVSGVYASGRDYSFGITKFDVNDTNLGTFVLNTSTSQQNDTISVSGLLLDGNVNVGDYYIPLGSADGANTTFTYDMVMTFQTISPIRGVVILGQVGYRYVNIVPTLRVHNNLLLNSSWSGMSGSVGAADFVNPTGWGQGFWPPTDAIVLPPSQLRLLSNVARGYLTQTIDTSRLIGQRVNLSIHIDDNTSSQAGQRSIRVANGATLINQYTEPPTGVTGRFSSTYDVTAPTIDIRCGAGTTGNTPANADFILSRPQFTVGDELRPYRAT